MFDAYERAAEFVLLAAIAEGLRDELGDEIEEQPALHDPDLAGQVNRAYRVTARCILRTIVPPSDDLAAVLNWVLTRLARRRLAEGGLDERGIALLLAMEGADRDDWLAFLILTQWPEIDELLRIEEDNGQSR